MMQNLHSSTAFTHDVQPQKRLAKRRKIGSSKESYGGVVQRALSGW